jgi:hypothetical protein
MDQGSCWSKLFDFKFNHFVSNDVLDIFLIVGIIVAFVAAIFVRVILGAGAGAVLSILNDDVQALRDRPRPRLPSSGHGGLRPDSTVAVSRAGSSSRALILG